MALAPVGRRLAAGSSAAALFVGAATVAEAAAAAVVVSVMVVVVAAVWPVQAAAVSLLLVDVEADVPLPPKVRQALSRSWRATALDVTAAAASRS